MIRHLQAGLLLAAGLAVVPSLAMGQAPAYPSKLIRLIVPFPAGGPNDIIGRAVAQKMTEALGQQVIIDNRSGSGGVLGTDVVAKAAPDGYTIALTSAGALAISPSLQKMPYDVAKDLAPITLVASVPELLVIGPSLNVANLTELLAKARAEPGRLNFASSGNGSMPHLAGELLKMAAKVDMVHVPYRGAAPAVNDILAGQVEMMFADTPVLMPHVEAGKLKAVAVGSRTRAPGLPNVPTMIEAGLPDVEAENWYGMVAPGATPPAVIDKLQATVAQALQQPDLRQLLSSQGANLIGNKPAEFAAYIASETIKWAAIVKASGAKID
jgi:tripartite-type tricarboxylate transporter receptor subunit TctC